MSSVKKQKQSDFYFDFLYIDQIEEIDDVIETSIEMIEVLVSQGKSEKAAKRFNKLPNNILLIKLITNSNSQKTCQRF